MSKAERGSGAPLPRSAKRDADQRVPWYTLLFVKATSAPTTHTSVALLPHTPTYESAAFRYFTQFEPLKCQMLPARLTRKTSEVELPQIPPTSVFPTAIGALQEVPL